MSFLTGVWRLFGADDPEDDDDKIISLPPINPRAGIAVEPPQRDAPYFAEDADFMDYGQAGTRTGPGDDRCPSLSPLHISPDRIYNYEDYKRMTAGYRKRNPRSSSLVRGMWRELLKYLLDISRPLAGEGFELVNNEPDESEKEDGSLVQTWFQRSRLILNRSLLALAVLFLSYFASAPTIHAERDVQATPGASANAQDKSAHHSSGEIFMYDT